MGAEEIPDWRGRRALVTGATGLLGRALSGALRAAGAEVHALSRGPAPAHPGPVHAWAEAGALAQLLVENNIDHVIHLASPIELGPELAATARLEAGVLHRSRAIGEACLAARRPLLHVGTCDEVAGGPAPFLEDAPPAPISAYAALKVAAAAHLRFLQLSHGLELRLVRPFRAIGPDDRRGLVAGAVQAARSGQPFAMTAGGQLRAWNDPQAIALGLLRAADQPAALGQWLHLSGGEQARVIDVVQAIFDLAGADPALIRRGALPERPGDPAVFLGDDRRARALLGPLPHRPLRALLQAALASAAAPTAAEWGAR